MAKRRKGSKYASAYSRQLSRIRRLVESLTSRGYILPDVIPQRPKTITQASVNRLKRITPDVVYSKAEFVDIETGEIVGGRRGRSIERSRAARKGAETRARRKAEKKSQKVSPSLHMSNFAIQQYRRTISKFNTKFQSFMFDWLNRLITDYGNVAVAQMILDSQADGHMIDYRIAYKGSDASQFVMDVMDYLPDAGPLYRETISEILEQTEDW